MRNAQNRYFHFLHFVFVILLKFYETLKRDYVHTLVVTPLIIKIDALTVIRNTFVTRCDAQNFPDIDKVDCDTSIAMWDPTGQPSTVTDLFGDYNPFGNTSTSTASMVRIYCFWGINFFVNWPVTQQLTGPSSKPTTNGARWNRDITWADTTPKATECNSSIYCWIRSIRNYSILRNDERLLIENVCRNAKKSWNVKPKNWRKEKKNWKIARRLTVIGITCNCKPWNIKN